MGLFSWLFGGNKKQTVEMPQESYPTSEQKKEAAWAEVAHAPESKPTAAPTAVPDGRAQKTTELLLMKLKERYPKGVKCSSQWKLINKLVDDGEYEINDLLRKADGVCEEEQGMKLEEYLEQNGMILRIWPGDYQEVDKLFVKYATKTFHGNQKELKAANKDVNWAAVQRIAEARYRYCSLGDYVSRYTPTFFSGNSPMLPAKVESNKYYKEIVDTLLAKLSQAFPDKVVQFAANDHNDLFMRIRETRCELRYPSSGAFLADYGYTYIPPEGSTECFETRETEPAPNASKPDAQEAAAVTPPPQPKAKETQQAKKTVPAAQKTSPKKSSSATKEAGTPVMINDDFTIVVPEGMRWSTDEAKNNDRLLVFIKQQRNKYYKEWAGSDPVEYDFSMPFSAPQCLTLKKGIDFSEALGRDADLSDSNMHGLILKMSEEVLSKTLTDDFNANIVYVRDDEKVISSYLRCKDNNTMFHIATPKAFYQGQIFINDTADVDERHELIEKWLGNIRCGAEDRPDIQPDNAFAAPAYKQKQRTYLGKLSIPVPDGMHTLSEGSNLQKVSSKDRKLLEDEALVIVPKGFAKGFSGYQEAPFSVCFSRDGIQEVSGFDSLWDLPVNMQKQVLTGILDQSLQNKDILPDYKIEFKDLGPKLDALYSHIEEGPDWCAYFVLFFAKTTCYQAMIYINAPKNKAAFHKAVERWISEVKIQ